MEDPVYRVGVGVGVLVFMIVVLNFRFGYAFELPEPPPSTSEMYAQKEQPTTEDAIAAGVPAPRPAQYERYLQQDSQKYGILPAASPGSMSRVFEYAKDETTRQLVPGETVDVLGLRLTVRLSDLPNTAFRQMELKIENLKSKTLAYRIETEPTVTAKACYRKRDLGHNAVAIRARATEIRSECVYMDGWTLTIKKVETMELNELGFAYVSAVPPARLAIDSRTSRGHRPPHEQTRLCNVVHSATVEQAMERKEVEWRDLVDFYARHRCESYAFPSNYRALTENGKITLPFGE